MCTYMGRRGGPAVAHYRELAATRRLPQTHLPHSLLTLLNKVHATVLPCRAFAVSSRFFLRSGTLSRASACETRVADKVYGNEPWPQNENACFSARSWLWGRSARPFLYVAPSVSSESFERKVATGLGTRRGRRRGAFSDTLFIALCHCGLFTFARGSFHRGRERLFRKHHFTLKHIEIAGADGSFALISRRREREKGSPRSRLRRTGRLYESAGVAWSAAS